jgi:two-component system sensor histidine kinase KdpD
LTPQALQKRMRRGDIYPVERTERALEHFFRPGNLIALRELALRQVTQVVDRSLEAFLAKSGASESSKVQERIAVCISPNPAAQNLIARGSRMAQGNEGDFYAIYVDTGESLRPEQRHSLDENTRFAENLGARVIRLRGGNIASAVADFVRENHITQVIFGRSAQTELQRCRYLFAIYRLMRKAPTVDMHIVTQEGR